MRYFIQGYLPRIHQMVPFLFESKNECDAFLAGVKFRDEGGIINAEGNDENYKNFMCDYEHKEIKDGSTS